MAKGKSELFDWIKAFIIALVAIFIIRTFLFSPIIVDGPSMLPTLHDRDQMIVDKITYRFKQPERFDIVIFHATSEKDYVKRVIGLPGEHVAVRDDTLYINDEEIDEEYLSETKSLLAEDETLTDDFSLEEITSYQYKKIPEGYVLVLGDNRDDSTDSRSSSLGLVSVDEIIGKARLIYWPLKRIQIVKE